MSLKVNVIHKGVIYRVKGIKVLCSVVTTVIISLFAIVGLGVWMLANVYEEIGNRLPNPPNSTQVPFLNKNTSFPSTSPSIDFRKPEDTAASADVLLQDLIVDESNRENLAYERYPEINEQFIPSLRLPNKDEGLLSDSKDKPIADVMEFEVSYGQGNPESTNLLDLFTGKNKIEERTLDTHEVSDEEANVDPYNIMSVTPEIKRISDHQESYNLPNNLKMDSTRENHEDSEYHPYHEINYSPIQTSYSDPIPHQIDRIDISHTPNVPTGKIITIRDFVKKPIKEKVAYAGPPVVGYGLNPYEKITEDKINEYDNFWRTYTGTNYQEDNVSHIFMKKEQGNNDEPVTFVESRPHLRGLKPSNVNYKIPIRPDAQVPHKVTLRKLPPPLKTNTKISQNRKLLTGEHQREQQFHQPIKIKSQHTSTTTISPSIPLLGPLHDIYDYSKKLAASLLSLNTKSASQIKDSSQKLGEYGIKLIETHNNVFKRPKKGPLSHLTALIPSTEKLKALDPFELSLITWTFMDFWEFLIEKVGTLSDNDLEVLQERLKRLRMKKDDAMTRVFMNKTMARYSSVNQRSLNNRMPRIRSQNDDIGSSSQPNSRPTVNNDKILGNLFTDNRENNSNLKETSINSQINRNPTTEDLVKLLTTVPVDEESEGGNSSTLSNGRSSWNLFNLFSSDGRMRFMQFTVKILFNFGKVYLRKPYALDCTMLLFCKDLNQGAKKEGMEGIAAKLKSVGLKVLTESEQEMRESDALGEVWRSLTAWTPLQCDAMFPRCDGPKALEIVNEVALGGEL